MSRLMLLVVFLTLSFAMLSQEDDEYLYMKDGIILGIKSELVEKCMGFMSDDITATEKEKEILCSCMMESLSKNYTYKEYMDLWEKDEAYLALFIADKNSSLYQDMMTCFRTKIEMLYPGAKFNTSMSKEVFMEECVKNVRNENLLYNYDVDELEFCNCVKDRVLSQGLAKLATGDIFDPNSLLHNEVYGPCLTIVDETSREQYTTVVNEATMNPSIPLLKYGTIYKVKVSFGSIIKYFTLDTGAEDLLISEQFMNDLNNGGYIYTDMHLGDGYYSVADGSIIKCERVLIKELNIGGYKIQNVEAAVVQSNIGFLLGNSVLSKFDKWTIDNQNSLLILSK